MVSTIPLEDYALEVRRMAKTYMAASGMSRLRKDGRRLELIANYLLELATQIKQEEREVFLSGQTKILPQFKERYGFWGNPFFFFGPNPTAPK